ncbi:hypothetical protein OIB37_23215 [Streptomyces sp. NBC_00820]|uniref:hypothetical protein n=1 Tax=Streptomyces sp. NBC_00820 TaxID=2975842 RepID=UPI002ED5FFC0|nr:hypothetical protein OIB37_23215 [Streptomyces sp. NBC_00820]
MDITQAAGAPRQTGDSDSAHALRLWAGWGLGLLLPMTGFSIFVAISSPRATRCLMYGEECASVPDGLLYASFWIAVLGGLLALLWPPASRAGVRLGAVLAQWGAQLTLCALILSYA